jgi:hypothetical protein
MDRLASIMNQYSYVAFNHYITCVVKYEKNSPYILDCMQRNNRRIGNIKLMKLAIKEENQLQAKDIFLEGIHDYDYFKRSVESDRRREELLSLGDSIKADTKVKRVMHSASGCLNWLAMAYKDAGIRTTTDETAVGETSTYHWNDLDKIFCLGFAEAMHLVLVEEATNRIVCCEKLDMSFIV